MTVDCYHLLGADEGIWRLVPIIALLVIGAVAKLLGKAKEKYEQEKAERMEQEYEREHRARYGPARQPPGVKPAAPPRREPTPAKQVMTALRQALAGEQPAAPAKPPSPPRAQRQQRGPKPAPKAAKRRASPGKGGVAARKLGSRARKLGRLDSAAEAPPAGAETPQPLTLKLNLADRNEALRGIVYAEILGPPKALRRGAEIWDL
jgi:hypothetical protein